MRDLVDRQAAIDAVDSETVSTNPEHFNSSEKFIKFMHDADIASFGEWQWANGFNTALVATKIQLEKLPSTQPERKKGELPEEARKSAEEYCEECNHIEMCGWYPYEGCEFRSITQSERKKGKWIPHKEISREYIGTVLVSVIYDYWLCDACGYRVKNGQPLHNFCPNCGADMRG